MRLPIVFAVAAALFAEPTTLLGQDTSAACRDVISPDGQLRCYGASVPQATVAYRRVELVDLLLDIATMKGERIEITGKGLMYLGMLGVTASNGAAEPVFIKIEKAPRSAQRLIVGNCGSRFCSVIVRGTVGDIMPGIPGIIADTIEMD